VTETVPVADGNDPAAGEDGGGSGDRETERRTTKWILEVAIVGDVERGLMALTAPAVLPAGPVATTGWRPSVNEPKPPATDDPTAATVEGFFDAVLAGDGDPSRYVAPRVAIEAADPPPFADTEVVSLAADEMTDGQYRVLAMIRAITPGGSHQMFSYELIVVERIDRLEIIQYSGAPTLVAGSAQPPEPEADAPAEGGAEAESEDQGDSGGESEADQPAETGADDGAPASTSPATTAAPASRGPASADPPPQEGE
jgi:hypothetical protein